MHQEMQWIYGTTTVANLAGRKTPGGKEHHVVAPKKGTKVLLMYPMREQSAVGKDGATKTEYLMRQDRRPDSWTFTGWLYRSRQDRRWQGLVDETRHNVVCVTAKALRFAIALGSSTRVQGPGAAPFCEGLRSSASPTPSAFRVHSRVSSQSVGSSEIGMCPKRMNGSVSRSAACR